MPVWAWTLQVTCSCDDTKEFTRSSLLDPAMLPSESYGVV